MADWTDWYCSIHTVDAFYYWNAMFLTPSLNKRDSRWPSFCQDKCFSDQCFPECVLISVLFSENSISLFFLSLTIYSEAEWHYARVYVLKERMATLAGRSDEYIPLWLITRSDRFVAAVHVGKVGRGVADFCFFLGVPVAPNGNQSRSDLCSLSACQNWKIF